MDRISRGVSSWKGFGIAPILAVLLLPLAPLSAQECEVAPHDPLVLDGQRIPFYEVFETFLLHAAVVYDTQGAAAYRDLLTEYGLDPEMQSLQNLPWTFDDLQKSIDLNHDEVRHEKARRLGTILARISSDLAANDPRGIAAVRDFRLRLGTQLRPAMAVSFVDGNPDFAKMDEAEDAFFASVEGAGGSAFRGEALGDGPLDTAHGENQSPAATRVKRSFLRRTGDSSLSMKELRPAALVQTEWRSYALSNGRTRVIGLFVGGEGPLALIDITFSPGHRVRDELQPEGPGGFRRYVESFVVDESVVEKSHTSLGCISANAAAALACVACASPPDPVTCSACVIALGAAAAACNDPHCDQIECNADCVQACHLYGWCSDTSGSSSPLDCDCFGIRDDTPGCGGDDDGCTEFQSVSVVREPGITVNTMNAREAVVLDAINGGRSRGSVIVGWELGTRHTWRQLKPDSVYSFICDDDGDGGGSGGGGGGGGDGDGGGGGESCTHCSCEGEFTSWEGEVCGSSADELVDECWNSCW